MDVKGWIARLGQATAVEAELQKIELAGKLAHEGSLFVLPPFRVGGGNGRGGGGAGGEDDCVKLAWALRRTKAGPTHLDLSCNQLGDKVQTTTCAPPLRALASALTLTLPSGGRNRRRPSWRRRSSRAGAPSSECCSTTTPSAEREWKSCSRPSGPTCASPSLPSVSRLTPPSWSTST